MNTKTPIVLLIYNRPTETKLVFEAIKKYQPKELFIIADGPKNNTDELLCNEVRNIVSQINWEVNVKTLFAKKNMGCVPRIISGLNWVFEQTESAIILEDDCLPNKTFFTYCNELLAFYKNDTTVMHISGCNLLEDVKEKALSYFFCNYALPSWGWATWARAWEKFNLNLDSWQKHKKEIFHHISQENFAKWTDTFEYIRIHKVGWDIPWNIDIWTEQGLTIMPCKNLIKNIGFNVNATFTKNKLSAFSNLKTYEMKFPLIHPKNKKTLFDKELEAACIKLLKEMD